MKKVLLLLVVFVLFGVIVFGIYFASNYNFTSKKNDKKENVELNKNIIDVESKDIITLIDTSEIDNGFVQKYQIIVNGIEKILEIEFLNNSDENVFSITGKFNGVTLYYCYQQSDKENIVVNKNMINNGFNENNFDFIKGENGKSYILIHSNISDDGTGEEDKLYILNDSLEFIDNDLVDYAGNSDTYGMSIMSTYISYKLEDNAYPWYADNFKACTNPSNCNIDLKIEDNKIYYLVPVLNTALEEANEDNKEATDYGKLEERVYTINDNKLIYKVTNVYKIVEVCEQDM